MNTTTLIHTPWLSLLLVWPRRRNAPRAAARSKPVVRIAGLR
jgi:hypothetical protein